MSCHVERSGIVRRTSSRSRNIPTSSPRLILSEAEGSPMPVDIQHGPSASPLRCRSQVVRVGRTLLSASFDLDLAFFFFHPEEAESHAKRATPDERTSAPCPQRNGIKILGRKCRNDSARCAEKRVSPHGIEDDQRPSHKSVLGRARLQPCRPEPTKTQALAPEVRSPPTAEDL
jgi:hypothetical protein